ncbi:thrombospondin type 3 repeat-containing protein, partial [Candidatus Woesearchaeota archaeon]|nr:thrombospondin type 3 repeat-containing protein [Candidatus Woesearchaeota archaeon]
MKLHSNYSKKWIFVIFFIFLLVLSLLFLFNKDGVITGKAEFTPPIICGNGQLAFNLIYNNGVFTFDYSQHNPSEEDAVISLDVGELLFVPNFFDVEIDQNRNAVINLPPGVTYDSVGKQITASGDSIAVSGNTFFDEFAVNVNSQFLIDGVGIIDLSNFNPSLVGDELSFDVGFECNSVIDSYYLSPFTCSGTVLSVTLTERNDERKGVIYDSSHQFLMVESGWLRDMGLPIIIEQCDDNNLAPADGCSDTCLIEDDWVCSGEPSICSTGADTDGDLVADDIDNCADVKNGYWDGRNQESFAISCDGDGDGEFSILEYNVCNQKNTDSATGDLLGDACEDDTDGDGVHDMDDDCPIDPTITSADGTSDVDNDGFYGLCDNCPTVRNPSQGDSDLDGIGTECDLDRDNDGVPNRFIDALGNYVEAEDNFCTGDEDLITCASNPANCPCFDNCPHISYDDQIDVDEDGRGDSCDNCILVAN